jgi:membrane protease YdiL (CAAX protease family)
VLMRMVPVPKAQLAQLQGLVDGPPLGVALVQFALLPAVCEEILFRGVLARSLGRRTSLAAAAAISAVVFAAYHVSAVQALPTLTLGLALGALAIRADSIAPTVVAHALNNAMAIAISRGLFPAVSAWLGRHPSLGVAACCAAAAGGLALALRGRR